jgi:hypothetical protein
MSLLDAVVLYGEERRRTGGLLGVALPGKIELLPKARRTMNSL